MPFIPQTEREELKNGGEPVSVGQMCYLEYIKLISKWRANTRWTTAHKLTKEWFDLPNDQETAKFLAWMVFFCREIMRYETDKANSNGDVL